MRIMNAAAPSQARSLPALVLWSLCLLPATAVAEEEKGGVSVSVSEDVEVRWYRVPERIDGFPNREVLNYVEQVARVTALMSSGDWSVFTQVDQVALFANRYYLDDELIIEREVVGSDMFSPLPGDSYANIEKLRLRLDRKAITMELGDTYAAFGRGAALNINRNVDIDIDTSIQGARVVGRPGAWDLTAVIGQLNRQQVYQDNPNIGLYGDLRHMVGGVRAERFGLGPANLGAHGVVYNFVSGEGWEEGFTGFSSTPDAVVGGTTAELMGVGGLDWYVEGDVFHYPKGSDVLVGSPCPGQDTEATGACTGYGAYLSTAAYIGSTTWLLEGKRYLGTELVNTLTGNEFYEVASAPTLEYERVITEDSSAALNSGDIYGARLRMDWAAIPGKLVPYVSAAVFRDLETGGLHFNDVPETIVHPVAGVEYIADEWVLLLNAGYRVDDRDGGSGQTGADRQLHADVDFKFPLPGSFHGDFNVGGERYQWGVNAFQQEDFTEVETATAVQYGSAVAFIGYFDVTTNPLVDTTGNLADALYGAAEVQVKPSSALTLKAFYGAYKAGIRCAGGQCRLLPGFEGARVSVAGTF